MTQRQAAVEATPTLRTDMSVREILTAVAAGRVVFHREERRLGAGHVWKGRDGRLVTARHATGRRLDFLEFRGIITPILRRGEVTTELTTLGWRRLEQLAGPLTPAEREKRRDAYPPPGHRLHRPGERFPWPGARQ